MRGLSKVLVAPGVVDGVGESKLAHADASRSNGALRYRCWTGSNVTLAEIATRGRFPRYAFT